MYIQSSHEERAPRLVHAYECLRQLYPLAYVEPADSSTHDWLEGVELTRPDGAAVRKLLDGLAHELGTEKRKLIAASFALRFGWTAAAAIGPFLVADCVPDLALQNIKLRFGPSALLERVALKTMRCTALARSGTAHPDEVVVESQGALLDVLRNGLCAHAEPVVSALASWSKLNQRALWGLVVSSWAAQFVNLGARLWKPWRATLTLRRFLKSNLAPFELAPNITLTRNSGVTRVCQRRGSCCMYYKTAAAVHCMTCPLLSELERRERQQSAADAS